MPICPLVKVVYWEEDWTCRWLLANLRTERITLIVFPHFNYTGSLLVGENDMLVPNDIYDVQHKRFPVFSLCDMTWGLTGENITEKVLQLHIQVLLLIRYFSKILLSKAIFIHKCFGHLQLLVSEPGLRTLAVIVTSGMCDQLAASCACPDFSQVLRYMATFVHFNQWGKIQSLFFPTLC